MKNTVEPDQAIEQGEKISNPEVRWVDQESSPKTIVSGQVAHVLYVIDQLCQLGGAERVLLEIIRRLPPDRFRCSVVTFQIGPAMKALENGSFPIQVLPLRRTYDIGAIKTAVQIRDLIRRENVSIVHTFFETSDLWAAPVAKMSGCPLLVSSRRDMGILRTLKHRLAYPIVNRLFDRILTVSEEVRSYALNHDHLPPQRVETLYNGVDLEALDAKAAENSARLNLGINPTSVVVSTLANIRYVKGIDVLARAAARIRPTHPDVVFLVIGAVLEPETFRKLQALIDSLGIKDNFRFLGARSNPFPILAASDVFCLPSRNEGFSNALVEAMGSRLPCVATRVGGNAEALKEGVNGFLVESEDADAMADRILRLLRDPKLRRGMGQAARQTVESHFSMNAMMNRLADIYQELLAVKDA